MTNASPLRFGAEPLVVGRQDHGDAAVKLQTEAGAPSLVMRIADSNEAVASAFTVVQLWLVSVVLSTHAGTNWAGLQWCCSAGVDQDC